MEECLAYHPGPQVLSLLWEECSKILTLNILGAMDNLILLKRKNMRPKLQIISRKEIVKEMILRWWTNQISLEGQSFWLRLEMKVMSLLSLLLIVDIVNSNIHLKLIRIRLIKKNMTKIKLIKRNQKWINKYKLLISKKKT